MKTGSHVAASIDHFASMRKSIRTYLIVGLVLFCGTIATVAVATIPTLDVGAHGFDKFDALVGLAIAITKASLVAAVFMHLNHERRLVYWVILLGIIHAGGFFIGTAMHFANTTHDRYFYGATETSKAAADDQPQSSKVSAPR